MLKGYLILTGALFGLHADAVPEELELGTVNREAEDVSVVELIADSEAHDGSIVRVLGVLQVEFESDQLCLSKEALRYSVTRNCLALGVEPEEIGTTREKLAEANGEYVLVEGVFRSSDHVHLSLFAGAIRQVTRILFWERAEGPREQGSNRSP